MELLISISYKGTLVCYKIERETPGIYLANLISCEVNEELALPQNITLMRGIRQWSGSCSDSYLLFKLGTAIEAELIKRLKDN